MNASLCLSCCPPLLLQAFFSLSFLEKLDLSWNQLTSLPVDFSTSLSALRELRLEHNNLHHVSGYRYMPYRDPSKCSAKGYGYKGLLDVIVPDLVRTVEPWTIQTHCLGLY